MQEPRVQCLGWVQEGYTGNTHACVTTKDCEKSVKVMEREKGGRHERKRKGERRKKKTRRKKQISRT